MTKLIFSILAFLTMSMVVYAQPKSREELEKQRQQLRKEIEETEKLLNSNKAQTKENLLQYNLISKKVNLQDRVIDNINRDLNRLDDNMYLISKDVRRYDLLLDTLKQEYAKSMVYAYKNRSSYDFLNFIFSSANFNDAMKRISYLKSYRNYREMQGDNIVRTQDLRKKRIQDLNGTKQEKSPIRKFYEDVAEPVVIEYVNPVARALNDTETWTIGDQGEFHPTIPYSFENRG